MNKKLLEILQLAIWDIRLQSRGKEEKQIEDLVDSVENIPGLLISEKEIDMERLKNSLKDYEDKYLDGENKYSKHLN